MSLDQQKFENEDEYKNECEESSGHKPQQTGGYAASLKITLSMHHHILLCDFLLRRITPLFFMNLKTK